jgi:mannose-6-phosphate isomerase-like protein (cupin superfamily)
MILARGKFRRDDPVDTEMTPSARASGTVDGQTIWFGNNRLTLKATAATTGGLFALWEALAPPGDSPALHVHRADDESFFVIEGRLRFRCGDRDIAAGPGSFVFLPRGVPHSFVVEGSNNARFLGLLTPGGGEQFFVDAGRPAEAEGLPPKMPPDIELLKRMSAKHGIQIVGPPMTPAGR